MAQLDKIRLSGTTYDIIDATALHTIDDNVTSGGTNAVKGSGIYNAITAATGALAETIAEQGYQTSGDVQSAISGKADAASAVTDVRVTYANGKGQVKYGVAKNGTFGTDTIFLAFDGGGFTLNDGQVSLKSGIIPSVSGYADAVAYDSNAKEMKFYHGGTGGTEVFSFDASPFLIDGMVQNVEIKDVTISGESVTCLVISFNTDAGKQDINIPISTIFDASNYYTTAQTDSAIEAATSGKADTTAVTESINEAVSGKADTTAFTAHTADTVVHTTQAEKDTWSGKQDALVSGTNIKTIGGNSLLGSGNIDWPAGMTATVSGTTLIFS